MNAPRLRGKRSAVVALAATGIVAATGAIAIGDGADKSADLKAQIDLSKPKNVIVLIGDGMGDSEVSSGRFYGKGAAGRLSMDALPFRGIVTTYGLSPAAAPPYPPNIVPDSAPTATAWSTGKKTIDGRVSQGPSSATNVPGSNEGYRTTFENAKARGMAIGNVSTAEITDATPAAPSSHISQRACQGPDDTRRICPDENKGSGGLGSIAEQQVDGGADVILGGGRTRYEQKLDGSETKTVLSYAQQKGYTYVANAAGLAQVDKLEPGKKLLGLFSGGNMMTEFAPLIATETGAGGPDFRCTEQRPAEEPALEAMTRKAISLLENDPEGFFLQVEGASIDKRDHSSDACGQIGELLAFDRAVGAALEYQKAHPDTLVVVSADHAHTSQIVPAGQTPRGLFATVKTADGTPMRLSYATGLTANAQSHMGATVPIMAVGPRAADLTGTIDQTEMFGPITDVKAPLPSTGVPNVPNVPEEPQQPGNGNQPPAPAPVVNVTNNLTNTVSGNTVQGGNAKSSSKPVMKPSITLNLGEEFRATTLQRNGLKVKYAASNAKAVNLKLVVGGKTIAARSTSAAAGRKGVTLRAKKASLKRGQKATLTVAAAGDGGTTTVTRRISVR